MYGTKFWQGYGQTGTIPYIASGVYIGITTLEGNLAISRKAGNVSRYRPKKHSYSRAQEYTDKDVHHYTALLAKVWK